MTNPTCSAEVIAYHAIDISHGCHLNLIRGEALGYLTDAATMMNIDADVVAEVGIMPLPLAVADDGPEATTVVYADGSAIRFGWDDEDCAEVMHVMAHVDAEPTATYY